MRISTSLTNSYEFACHSSSCRPPTSGGTGGSKSSGPGGPVHMPTGKLVPTVAKRWVPGKDNVIGKYTPEQQANVRARIDRAMGIRPQASLKQIAQDRMKQGPMRNVSNATLKQSGGSIATAPKAAAPKTAKHPQEARMKPGSSRTIKDDSGTKIGVINRDSKGQHHYRSANGFAVGNVKNVTDGVDRLKRIAPDDRLYSARSTRPAQRSADQKAALNNNVADRNSMQMSRRADIGPGQSLKAFGPVKATQVSITRDGSFKIKGETTRWSIKKRGDGRYVVPPALTKDDREMSYKTQAAAKSGVARYITALANAAAVQRG